MVACFPEDAGLDAACFKVSYDVLVLAVRYLLRACASKSYCLALC